MWRTLTGNWPADCTLVPKGVRRGLPQIDTKRPTARRFQFGIKRSRPEGYVGQQSRFAEAKTWQVMQNMVHRLPVLGDHEATDPAKIVKWAKDTLNLGRAVPKLLEGYNLLHFSVSKEIRVLWAALTSGVEGSPADDYPEDMNLDSEDEADLTKKREWHVDWLETVIAYYGTNQQDSVFDVVRRIVKWNWDAALATEIKINQWALSCSKAQNAVSEEAWSAADAKALFTACAKVLPEEVKSLLNQNKPAEGHHTWQTAAKFLNERVKACIADEVFRSAIGFVGTRSTKPDREAAGNSNGEKAQRQRQWHGKGGKNNGQRGRGQSPNHPVADEVAKEQTGGKGKAGKSTEKGGKPGGKAGGKAGKRKREGKGEAEPTPNKKKKADVECFNCGEKGHYKNQCRKPLRITDGSADADE